MSPRDFEETVKHEEARLRIVHPTAEDIPGCMSLLDDFLSCNSAHLSGTSTDTSKTLTTPPLASPGHSAQIAVSVWRDVQMWSEDGRFQVLHVE